MAIYGEHRPPFADAPAPGQRSVWDFPRPPRIEAVSAELSVAYDGVLIATSTRCQQVLETAGAPTYYFPPDDVREDLIKFQSGRSIVNGKASPRPSIWTASRTPAGGWTGFIRNSYCLQGWYAFYPQRVDCFVDAEKARPQPGGYYGGWVTDDIAGPIKGEPGSEAW